MGSITKKGNKLTVTLEIKRIMVSQISFVGNQAVEGMTFKAAVANLALKLVREKAPEHLLMVQHPETLPQSWLS